MLCLSKTNLVLNKSENIRSKKGTNRTKKGYTSHNNQINFNQGWQCHQKKGWRREWKKGGGIERKTKHCQRNNKHKQKKPNIYKHTQWRTQHLPVAQWYLLIPNRFSSSPSATHSASASSGLECGVGFWWGGGSGKSCDIFFITFSLWAIWRGFVWRLMCFVYF